MLRTLEKNLSPPALTSNRQVQCPFPLSCKPTLWACAFWTVTTDSLLWHRSLTRTLELSQLGSGATPADLFSNQSRSKVPFTRNGSRPDVASGQRFDEIHDSNDRAADDSQQQHNQRCNHQLEL